MRSFNSTQIYDFIHKKEELYCLFEMNFRVRLKKMHQLDKWLIINIFSSQVNSSNITQII